MKCDKTDPLLYLSARVGVLSAALPSWEELMRRPEREEAAPERQDALPLREDAQTGALLESLARGAGRPIVDLFRFPFDCHNAKVLLKGALTGQGAAARELLRPAAVCRRETMREALREESGAKALPAWRLGIAEARHAWTESRSPQLLDAALDRALYRGMSESALYSSSAAAQEYVRAHRWRQSANHAAHAGTCAGSGGGTAAGRRYSLWPGCWKRAPVALWLPCLPPRLCARRGELQRAAGRGGCCSGAGPVCRRCSAYAFGPEALLAFLLRLELRRRGCDECGAEKVLPAEMEKKRLEGTMAEIGILGRRERAEHFLRWVYGRITRKRPGRRRKRLNA